MVATPFDLKDSRSTLEWITHLNTLRENVQRAANKMEEEAAEIEARRDMLRKMVGAVSMLLELGFEHLTAVTESEGLESEVTKGEE